MVKLVTYVNGVAAVLFHVEHSSRAEWQWRWRVVGGHASPHLGWRHGRSRDSRVVFHPEVTGCAVEAQWLDTSVAGGQWRQAALHRVGTCEALFEVRALESPFRSDGFEAVAMLSSDMVACYRFGPLDLEAGRSARVRGVADGPFADNVLLAAGEFSAVDKRLSVVNATPCDPSCFELSGSRPVLSAVDGSAQRGLFVRVGRGVDPTLLES